MNIVIEEIKKNIEALKKQRSELFSVLSNYDSATDDILHVIESGNVNGAEIMKLTKQIKEIRKARREVKNKISEINSVIDKIGDIKEPKSAKADKYTFKTNIVAQTLPKYSKYIKGSSYKFKD